MKRALGNILKQELLKQDNAKKTLLLQGYNVSCTLDTDI